MPKIIGPRKDGKACLMLSDNHNKHTVWTKQTVFLKYLAIVIVFIQSHAVVSTCWPCI